MRKTEISDQLADLKYKRHYRGLREEAKKEYKELLNQEPNEDIRAEIYRNLAKIARDENDYEGAKDLIKTGLRLENIRKMTEDMLTLSLAELYDFRLRDSHEAIKLYLTLQEGRLYPNIKAKIGLGNARYTDRSHHEQYYWYREALDLLGGYGSIELRAQALIGLGIAKPY